MFGHQHTACVLFIWLIFLSAFVYWGKVPCNPRWTQICYVARLALDAWSFCNCFSSPGITSMYHSRYKFLGATVKSIAMFLLRLKTHLGVRRSREERKIGENESKCYLWVLSKIGTLCTVSTLMYEKTSK